MARVKVRKSEIIKMLKDQLGCKEVKFDKSGNAILEIDFDKIKKRQKKEEHHYYYPCPTPIIIEPTPEPINPYRPFWVISNSDTSVGTMDYELTYCCSV